MSRRWGSVSPAGAGLQQLTLTVVPLRRDGKIRVRLVSARGESVVDGAYVSPEALRFKTPPHEQHGALPCEVSVSVGSHGWTVNPLKFQVRLHAHAT